MKLTIVRTNAHINTYLPKHAAVMQRPRQYAGWNDVTSSNTSAEAVPAKEAVQLPSNQASSDAPAQLTGLSRRKAAQLAAQAEDRYWLLTVQCCDVRLAC